MVKAQRYKYKGTMWTRYIEETYSMWCVGVDLGQRVDYTAVSVIEHTREPIDDWVADEVRGTTRQKVREQFIVRGLQRLPLGLDYPLQAARIADLLSGPPLRGLADMVVDDASVGAPVADQFESRWAIKPVRVTLTGNSLEVTRHAKRRYTVPKILLVSHLDARLNNGELIFSEGLAESEALRDELQNFQRHITAAGRSTFEARGSKHDDIVISLGLSVWWCIAKHKLNFFHVGPLKGLV